MNVYEYAMEMEKKAEQFYRELSANTEDAALKAVVDMLAEEEVKHYDIFKKMANDNFSERLPESTFVGKIKQRFQNMKDSGKKFTFAADQVEMYQRAKEIEDHAYEFYMDAANRTQDELERDALLKIAAEEQRHVVLMENLVEFVNRPNQWLENAEFNNMEEY